MSDYLDYKNKDWLYEHYINKNLSGRRIANIYGYSADAVRKWIKKFKLTKPIPSYRNRDWLYQRYWIERLSTREIAKKCGCASSAISRWMKINKIKARLWNYRGIQGGNGHSSWRGGVKSYWHRMGHKVWSDFWNQKVPSGYLIHHVDKDITNIDVSNLALVTSGFHAVIHERGQYKRNRRWWKKP